ncbi:MAG: hypothetical protein BroJett026_17350 [Betaproteobacteria bacterium]|nr:MAG: hypothetical protein BroJett026_17350 [Betaproteobacteria bacterium]
MLAAGSTVVPEAAQGAPAPRRRLEIVHRHEVRRGAIERFVAGVYRRRYGARIVHWAPVLVALRTDGRLVAAAGYRRADAPLYLERYLDVPIEHALAACTGMPVARALVCEVGHFASAVPGEGRRLMRMLARHLAAAGLQWVASTATRELRELLFRIGLTPCALAPADPARLGSDAEDWGDYYEHAPVVVAGELARGLAALERGRRG